VLDLSDRVSTASWATTVERSVNIIADRRNTIASGRLHTVQSPQVFIVQSYYLFSIVLVIYIINLF